jgi:hypothetical protein
MSETGQKVLAEDGYPEYIEQQEYVREEKVYPKYEGEPHEETEEGEHQSQEESTDEDAEREGQEEEEEVKRTPKKSGDELTYKTKLNRTVREKERLQYELQQQAEQAYALQAELDKRSQELEAARSASLYFHGDNINQKKQMALARKAAAYENGDVKAQVDADAELASIAVEEYQTNLWKNDQEYRQRQYVAQQQAQAQYYQQMQAQQNMVSRQPYGLELEKAKGWLDRNQWANKYSQEYDPELSHYVDLKTNEYEASLQAKGEQYKLYSDEYFNMIDSFARPHLGYQQNKELRMKSGNSGSQYVSPTSNRSAAGGRSSSGGDDLTPIQKKYANKFGIKHEDYAKAIRHDKKVKPHNYGGAR